MSGRHHPGVDAYIDGLPGWQRDLCLELRRLIHAADPEIEETVKRTVQLYRDDPVNGTAITNLVRAIADRNRAGGWRRLGPDA